MDGKRVPNGHSGSKPGAEWTQQQALCALKYHTALVLHLLERLDLPMAHLQELRLGLRRSRPATSPLAGGAPGGRAWRVAAWGGVYLAMEPLCPAWRSLWASSSSLACGAATAAEPAARGGQEAVFGCLGAEDAALVSEVEVHVCAALQHLSRVLGQERASHPSSRRAGQAAPSSRPASPTRARPPPAGAPPPPGPPPPASPPAPGPGEAGAHGPPQGAAPAAEGPDALVRAAWAFFLRAQLANALLRGDVLAAAAWSVRFLGVGEPWSLRRTQEMVLASLELATERAGAACAPPAAPEGQSRSSAAGRSFLCESCAAYLAVPIIPRFTQRLQKCAADLRDLLKDTGGASQRFEAVLSSILDPVAQDGAPADFDGSGRGLEEFRAQDALYAAFCRAFAEAAAAHLEGACSLDPRPRILAGVEAASLIQGEGAWPEEERQLMLSTVLSTPQHMLKPRGALTLADMEEDALPEADGTSPGAIGLQDVRLDLADTPRARDLSRVDVATCDMAGLVAAGLCCSTVKRRHPRSPG